MKIGDLSKLCGLSVHTIRYYEKVGLLPQASRNASGQRQYGAEIVTWLTFLGQLKATGMGIADMVHYTRLRQQGPETAEARRAMLEKQRQSVLSQISHLERLLPVLDKKISLYHDIKHAHLLEAKSTQEIHHAPDSKCPCTNSSRKPNSS